MSFILGPDGKPLPDAMQLIQPNTSFRDDDRSLPSNMRHNPVEASAHISRKVTMFPPSFMALKQELEMYHKPWFEAVHPDIAEGTMSPAVAMIYAGEEFVMVLNHYTKASVDLDLPDATEAELQAAADRQYIHFDSGNVAGICHEFLNRLRKMRGLSPLSS